ncbi:type II toxin-antitoxin system RelE/ParE family toxin [Salegentibacter tibetensis]|uniref:type II toxin-antitoxin system RelE/ParE family toxin n=1 Tax=Salegentibacter tibetensis TaxID=2873600 RepID=UPI00293D2BA3|nr:type II toxin-antitoxin system RelE/ParE family toxin [Salegentibacter tibetensis]
MAGKIKVEFLEEVLQFLDSVDVKAQKKILLNIDKFTHTRDKELFKKLSADIWEFRRLYNKKQYRLFAFWDKRKTNITVVVATHGIIKKNAKNSEEGNSESYRANEKIF